MEQGWLRSGITILKNENGIVSSSFEFFFMDLGSRFPAFPLMTGLVLLVCRLNKIKLYNYHIYICGLMIIGHGLPKTFSLLKKKGIQLLPSLGLLGL